MTEKEAVAQNYFKLKESFLQSLNNFAKENAIRQLHAVCQWFVESFCERPPACLGVVLPLL